MKILCSPKEGKKEVLTLFVEGEEWRDIHTSIFGRCPSFPSECASWEEWKEFFSTFETRQVKNYVIRRLAAQSYHTLQLKKLLAERLVSASLSSKVIQEYVQLGYLDDKAWIESFVRGQSRRHSQRAILFKLQAKGIPVEQCTEILERFQDPDQEKQKILRLLQTRHRSKDLQDPADKRKVVASLMRKGFSFDLIKSALAEANSDR